MGKTGKNHRVGSSFGIELSIEGYRRRLERIGDEWEDLGVRKRVEVLVWIYNKILLFEMVVEISKIRTSQLQNLLIILQILRKG